MTDNCELELKNECINVSQVATYMVQTHTSDLKICQINISLRVPLDPYCEVLPRKNQ